MNSSNAARVHSNDNFLPENCCWGLRTKLFITAFSLSLSELCSLATSCSNCSALEWPNNGQKNTPGVAQNSSEWGISEGMPQILVPAVVQRTRIPVMLTHSQTFPLPLRELCQILSEDPMTIVVFSILGDKPFPPEEVCEFGGFIPSCLGCRPGLSGLQRNWVREMKKFQSSTNKAPKLLLVSQNIVRH